MGLYFGSSSAPSIAQRIMSVLVAWWYMLVIVAISPHTSWDVVSQREWPEHADSDRLAQQCGYPVQGKETRSNMRARMDFGVISGI
jgi:hypothetical protein